MQNAVIYVFSGTGNTKKICELYKAEFEKNGVETTLCDVGRGFDNLPDPNDFDCVGIAYPIHAFNAPKIMLDLARRLPKAAGKKYFVLKSSGEPLKINNVSSYKMRGILKRKGYEQFAEYHYVMPYNMIFRHTDDMATNMWNTARALAPIEAREVLAMKPHMLKGVPFGHLFAWILRIEHPAMRVNGKLFKVDKNKCINCGMCARNCPVNNIVIKDGKFRFKGDCLMCTRCSFNCPTDAFSIALLNGWRINGKYDMEYDGEPQKNSHAWYCKKAYKRYFDSARDKINADLNRK
ncbi:MAG: EFR1 family ferrodoxin [Bacteroides sp.]|nr:EFR1 family ferrodoxin [Bacillota bacterium]MCM1394358.1 EFR1 family ferrodoxin [[Eubacterium] siraeum]MCM1456058.1 EFR1 family ferrodoxin [Bacteroides sp.]